MKIAVLISGGVDSSVALNLLARQGHDVTAFYLKIWLEEDFAGFGQCPWEEDLVYVRQVCQDAGVPLFIVPMQKEYFETVVAYTINEVKEGRTPNPDIFCNKLIKFGIFLDKFGHQFDKIATGHYARVCCKSKLLSTDIISSGIISSGLAHRDKACIDQVHTDEIFEDGLCQEYELRCAPDQIKDQTYFLSYLDQRQLSKLIFPIGHLNKSQVRELAHEYNLPNKDRKDSQGICFLGKFKFQDFLKHYIGTRAGDLIEFESGKKLGSHEGFWFYTIGQRKGSGLSGGPWYVVDKKPEKNIVYISKNYYSQEKIRDKFQIERVNWISGHAPEKLDLQVKLRHGKSRVNCRIEKLVEFGQENQYKDIINWLVKLESSDQGIAPGQFAVFYLDDVCLGGGVISAKI